MVFLKSSPFCNASSSSVVARLCFVPVLRVAIDFLKLVGNWNNDLSGFNGSVEGLALNAAWVFGCDSTQTLNRFHRINCLGIKSAVGFFCTKFLLRSFLY